MNSRPPQHLPGADVGDPATAPAAATRPGQRLITVILLTAAALDLTGAASSWQQPGTRPWPRG
jgi:hypothetical protein